MTQTGQDTLKTRRTLNVAGKDYAYYSLPAAAEAIGADLSKLPFSLKVLMENLLRYEDGRSVTVDDVKAMGQWVNDKRSDREIAYRPARVLMQDFTGVPAVVDLAAMRNAIENLGGDPRKINPLAPVDLVIDHSVMVDHFGSGTALGQNVALEYERNAERYQFLRWGSGAFENFRVVPPGTGICHQVNLEYLAQTVWTGEDQTGATVAYPDTLVGTDSHTTMVNGLSVLGWGVGGIEAEAAMLGQPVSMLIPEVIGFKLTGKLREGVTATDLVLTVTQMLRARGVVGKFVEFYGPGLDHLSLEDQATIANMAPEYGATCGFFPIDAETLNYLKTTGREPDRVALVEAYAKEQGLFRTADTPDPVFTDTLELDMSEAEPSLAGPKRPQDRVLLSDVPDNFADALVNEYGLGDVAHKRVPLPDTKLSMGHGDVVIAAITSCTNTSNPSVMVAAGLVARKALARGLEVKDYVKTSLAPGSQIVAEYLTKSGLQDDLDKLGFNVVGFGCTTCIGNSGPLPDNVTTAINEGGLATASVLSGNRNFEGRVNPLTRANYLASPPLVVAFAIAGTVNMDLTNQPLGYDDDNEAVFLSDIWPTNEEIAEVIRKTITPEMFKEKYGDVFKGDDAWQKISATPSLTYEWDSTSTYVQHPPYFDGMTPEPEAIEDIEDARILGLFADSITTDHISPAGNIKKESPAGDYLLEHQVRQSDFNSYGARRGNHQVMMRGTFANIRIKNEMLGGEEGGYTIHRPSGDKMAIYDAAMRYKQEGVPLVVVAGKEYGTGSSRDWAAKGTNLLGVRAVIAESFERIHRSNLIGMGVVPFEFAGGKTRESLSITGDEQITITGLGELKPRTEMTATVKRNNGETETFEIRCRIDTLDELDYLKNGGILHYVLRQLLKDGQDA